MSNMINEIKKRRTFAIISHPDAGKTTLTEKFLLYGCLLYTSSKDRIKHVEDVLTLGDKVKVVCLGKDKMGRISFSMKDVAED